MNCEICQEQFDLAEKKPFVLMPCIHSYCSECINKFKESKCPNCRQSFYSAKPNWTLLKLLPESRVDKLKQNIQNYSNQIECLKEQFRLSLEQKFSENRIKINKINSQIFAKTNELINEIFSVQIQLINQTGEISNRMTRRLNDLKEKENNIEICALKFKDQLEINHDLTEKEMRYLSQEMLMIINGFKSSLNQIDQPDEEYELNGVSSFDFKLVKVSFKFLNLFIYFKSSISFKLIYFIFLFKKEKNTLRIL